MTAHSYGDLCLIGLVLGTTVSPPSPVDVPLGAWQDLTLIILIVAAAASLALGIKTEGVKEGWYDGGSIAFAVFLVIFVTDLGFLYWNSIKRIEFGPLAQDLNTVVIRGGRPVEISIFDIVVGDVVPLSIGDQVPADGILITGHSLAIDESSMTGESKIVHKDHKAPFLMSGCKVADGVGTMLKENFGLASRVETLSMASEAVMLAPLKNLLDGPVFGFSNLLVEGDLTIAILECQKRSKVTGVGINTEWGLLMASISEDTGERNPLAGIVGLAVAVSVLAVLLIRYFTGHTRDSDGTVQFKSGVTSFGDAVDDVIKIITIAVTIVVVAVPEGLPLAVTLTLAYSMRKMMADKALACVRRLSACETMGSATTICSDKTGTLTLNKMTVVEAYVGRKKIDPPDDSSQLHPDVSSLLHEGIACNTQGNVFVPKNILIDGSPCSLSLCTVAAMIKFRAKVDYRHSFKREPTPQCLQSVIRTLRAWGCGYATVITTQLKTPPSDRSVPSCSCGQQGLFDIPFCMQSQISPLQGAHGTLGLLSMYEPNGCKAFPCLARVSMYHHVCLDLVAAMTPCAMSKPSWALHPVPCTKPQYESAMLLQPCCVAMPSLVATCHGIVPMTHVVALVHRLNTLVPTPEGRGCTMPRAIVARVDHHTCCGAHVCVLATHLCAMAMLRCCLVQHGHLMFSLAYVETGTSRSGQQIGQCMLVVVEIVSVKWYTWWWRRKNGISGSPTEKAILAWAVKLGMKFDVIREDPQFSMFSLSTQRKREGDNKVHIHWKGAAEMVLGSCTEYLDSMVVCSPWVKIRSSSVKLLIKWLQAACAVLQLHTEHLTWTKCQLMRSNETNGFCLKMTLFCFPIVGIKDPCRSGVQNAVRICTNAGVKGCVVEDVKTNAFNLEQIVWLTGSLIPAYPSEGLKLCWRPLSLKMPIARGLKH
ncbi:Calcium-transporting ATPase 9, plasma membrane-type [Vitis vinifera]|uniref:Calcium-transporting ATPase 9, plasma membrane-type n=1 Tax=Vitis vinifera TaxID=29760 RepID=A0A438HGX9_VITVI|nr:Calcium-transporting ATPase 9, plasma membrane-type [Vitis vinifera]